MSDGFSLVGVSGAPLAFGGGGGALLPPVPSIPNRLPTRPELCLRGGTGGASPAPLRPPLTVLTPLAMLPAIAPAKLLIDALFERDGFDGVVGGDMACTGISSSHMCSTTRVRRKCHKAHVARRRGRHQPVPHRAYVVDFCPLLPGADAAVTRKTKIWDWYAGFELRELGRDGTEAAEVEAPEGMEGCEALGLNTLHVPELDGRCESFGCANALGCTCLPQRAQVMEDNAAGAFMVLVSRKKAPVVIGSMFRAPACTAPLTARRESQFNAGAMSRRNVGSLGSFSRSIWD